MRRVMGSEELAAWRRAAIRNMRRSRRATLRLLDEIPLRQIKRARTQGEWSIKDVLAHIVAWEEEAVRRLEKIMRGRGDRLRFYDDVRAVDRFNARAVAAERSTPWPKLLRRAAEVRARLVEKLERLPLKSLNEPTHRYTVVDWLPEFAWTHEAHHRRRIRNWWLRVSKSAAARRA